MYRFEDVLSIVISIVLRKSVSVYREFEVVLADMVSILSSVVRFSISSLLMHRYANYVVPDRHSPMFIRPDR